MRRKSRRDYPARTVPEMRKLKAQFPILRRSHPVAIVHSGAKATVYGCLCGAYTSESTDSKIMHGPTARVVNFFKEHKSCAARILAGVLPRKYQVVRFVSLAGDQPLTVYMPIIAEGA